MSNETNNQIRILLVDDNRTDRRIIRRMLEEDANRRYLIFEAETGEETLELAVAIHPDCIILDNKLPDTDGLDLLPRLHSDLNLALIPVVFTTGRGSKDIALEGFRRGAEEFVDKLTLSTQVLSNAIDNALKRSQLPTRLELALRESEERFRLLIESVKDTAIFFLDPEGKVSFWNASADRLFGYSADEIGGQPFSVFFTQEDVAQAVPDETLNIARRDGHHGGMQQRRRKDGEVFWADIYVATLKDQTGSIRGYAEVTRDISDRMHSERELRKTETRLKRLVYSNITGIVFWNHEGTLLDANGAFLRIVRRTREELDRGELNFFTMTPPELLTRNMEAVAEVARTGTFGTFESQLIRNDGSTVSVLLAGADLGDGSNEYVTFVVDISDQVHARKKIEQAVKVRDEFLSIASHELKTPITSLRLQIQLTLRTLEKQPASQLSRRLSQILQSSDSQIGRLVKLVDDLLDVARVAEGRMKFRYEKFDLMEEVREVAERFRDHYESMNVQIRFGRMEPSEGNWDRFRISQVLENLYSNALKYGQGQPVDVSCHPDGENVVFTIRDYGLGIAPENHGKIFERFERIASSENIVGLGLGLYIARNIIRAHAGEIEIESELGKGALFRVILPKVPPG